MLQVLSLIGRFLSERTALLYIEVSISIVCLVCNSYFALRFSRISTFSPNIRIIMVRFTSLRLLIFAGHFPTIHGQHFISASSHEICSSCMVLNKRPKILWSFHLLHNPMLHPHQFIHHVFEVCGSWFGASNCREEP